MDEGTRTLKSFQRVVELFTKDLDALPEDAFAKSFGPKVRTVADIVCEVNMVNDDIYRNMKGETPIDWPEGWVKAPVDLQTKAGATESFGASTQKFLAMVEGYSESDWVMKVQTEHGERDRIERVRFATIHLWYHLGQINFVQTLLGDDAWHW